MTGTNMAAQKPEQGTDVAVIKGVAHVVAQPELLGDAERINALDAMSRAPEVVAPVV